MTFSKSVTSRIVVVCRAAFWNALVIALTMALLPHPPALPIDAFGDKFEHVVTFSVMSLLAAFAYVDGGRRVRFRELSIGFRKCDLAREKREL